MKVKGRVKLLCPSCVKVKVQVTRDQGYLQIKCTKNPRHNQRTKWPSQQTFSTCAIDTAQPPRATDTLPRIGPPTHLHLSGQPMQGISALLAARTNASLGELYWRTASFSTSTQ